MDKQQIIANTAEYVKNTLEGEGSGHDWFHIYRVWNLAKTIGEDEKADMFVVELAALLHDIADWKFHGGDETVAPRVAKAWLAKQWMEQGAVQDSVIDHVCDIILTISFKGAGEKKKMKTLEGMIVQDADRLDALGAIGIARCFTYGGYKKRVLYDPAIKPVHHETFEDYKTKQTTTLNHFYEKLLLLKDLMNTNSAKAMAQERHVFMENFLNQFYVEWEG